MNRAQQEAKLSEELLEQKRRLEIEKQENGRKDAQRQFENKANMQQVEHTTSLELLKEKQDVAKTSSNATVQKAKSEGDIMLKTVQMSAANEAQLLRLANEQEQARATQQLRITAFRQQIAEQELQQATESAVKLSKAKAEAEALLSKAQAEARARVCLAEADAKAGDMIGKAYSKNAEFVKFKMAELQQQVAVARAEALASAMANNKGAMMPVELQKELTTWQ